MILEPDVWVEEWWLHNKLVPDVRWMCEGINVMSQVLAARVRVVC